MKRLSIGFDVDDVLIPLTKAALREMEYKFQHGFIFDEIEYGFRNLPEKERLFGLYLFMDTNFLKSVKIPENNIELLKEIHSRRHDIFFTTNPYLPVMTTRAISLVEQVPFIPSQNYIITGRKDVLKLNMLFDDKLENIEECIADIPVLVNNPWNQKTTKSFIRKEPGDYLDIIDMAEDGMSRQEIYRELNPKFETSLEKGVIIVGSSGAGKTTIVEKIKEKMPDSVIQIVSHTTRTIRRGEIDGKSYHFVDVERFHKLLKGGKMLECSAYAGNLYGTSYEAVEEALSASKGKRCAIVIMDFNGQKAMMKKYPEQFTSIFIDRDKNILVSDILSRDISNEAKTERIRQLELDYRYKNQCQYCIQNNKTIEEAAEEIINIIF